MRWVGVGVVESKVAAGGFGGEPVVACDDDDALVFAVAGELVQVGIVGQPQPQVQATAGQGVEVCVGGRSWSALTRRSLRGELLPGRTQMRAPSRLSHDIDSDGLQCCADVHCLRLRVRKDAITRAASCDEPRDPHRG